MIISAKWSSTEDIAARDNSGSFKDLPSTWTPRNLPSPSPDRKDFKPINFESNSLKKSKRSVSIDLYFYDDQNDDEISQGQSAESPAPGHKVPPVGECFAWKDNTLDRDLRAIKVNTEIRIYNLLIINY